MKSGLARSLSVLRHSPSLLTSTLVLPIFGSLVRRAQAPPARASTSTPLPLPPLAPRRVELSPLSMVMAQPCLVPSTPTLVRHSVSEFSNNIDVFLCTVTVAGLSVTGQYFSPVTTLSSSFSGDPIDGILGLAWPAISNLGQVRQHDSSHHPHSLTYLSSEPRLQHCY